MYCQVKKAPSIAESSVTAIASAIAETLNLTLFGFDLLRDSESGQLYIVDLNYFPGYSGVHDVDTILGNHILHVSCSS